MLGQEAQAVTVGREDSPMASAAIEVTATSHGTAAVHRDPRAGGAASLTDGFSALSISRTASDALWRQMLSLPVRICCYTRVP
jgi:hypothetical protein